MLSKTYNCSQQQLCTAAILGWHNCQKQLPQFQQFSSRYKQAFINTHLQQIDTIQNLPDYQARNATSEILHIKLIQQAKTCLWNWQKLKRYIASAWPANLQKPKLDGAGQQHYRKASRKYWAEMQALLTTSSNFIKENLAQLTDDQNMPPVFQTTFNTDQATFQKIYNDFLKSEESAPIATTELITANNNIHANLMSMLLDAQEIFRQQPMLKKQFTFEYMLNLLRTIKAVGVTHRSM